MANPELETRKKGAIWIAIGIGILIVLLLLLAGTNPEVGQRYPWWVRALARVLAATGWIAALVGVFKVIVGPGKGMLAGLLKGIAITVVFVGGLAGAVLGWAFNEIIDDPRAESSDSDWDDD